jgi:cytochrome c oxidase subunit 2
MNCVPGMTTRLSFKPTISTAEMRKNPEVIAQYKKVNENRAAEGREEVDFNYLLLCNKICGGSHYNMQMNIVVVDTQAEFDSWFAKQKESKTFAQLAGLVKPVEAIVEIADSAVEEVIVIKEEVVAAH